MAPTKSRARRWMAGWPRIAVVAVHGSRASQPMGVSEPSRLVPSGGCPRHWLRSCRAQRSAAGPRDGILRDEDPLRRSLAHTTEMTSCAWRSSPPTSKRAAHPRATRTVRDATPVGLGAERCARGCPPLSEREEWCQGLRRLVFQCRSRRRPIPVPVADSGLRPIEIRAVSEAPAVVHRTSRRSARAITGRALDAEPATVLRDYFSAARTRSAKELAAKAVVLINPEQLAGKVVWPVASPSE